MEGVRSADPFELFEAPVASESDVEGAITAAAARGVTQQNWWRWRLM